MVQSIAAGLRFYTATVIFYAINPYPASILHRFSGHLCICRNAICFLGHICTSSHQSYEIRPMPVPCHFDSLNLQAMSSSLVLLWIISTVRGTSSSCTYSSRHKYLGHMALYFKASTTALLNQGQVQH